MMMMMMKWGSFLNFVRFFNFVRSFLVVFLFFFSFASSVAISFWISNIRHHVLLAKTKSKLVAGTHSTMHSQPVFSFFSWFFFFPLFRSFIPLTNVQYCWTCMRRPYNAYYKANLLKFIFFVPIFKHMEHRTNTARNANNFRKIFLFTNFFLFFFSSFEI